VKVELTIKNVTYSNDASMEELHLVIECTAEDFAEAVVQSVAQLQPITDPAVH
jgi:hypothetical protein